MLILTRGPQESIHIGDDIEVRVLEVRGNQVRIGIAAPKDVDVLREELVRCQGLEAVQPTTRDYWPR